MSIDKPLARLRERTGLTQLELAHKIGVSENTIANWEKGSASKWIQNLKKLCNILQCDLEDLEPEPENQELLSIEITPDVLEQLKKYCKAVINNDKKTVAAISYLADLENQVLRYWLDQANSMLNKSSQNPSKKLDYETVYDTLILNNLTLQLSNASLDIDFNDFKKIVKQFELERKFFSKEYISFNKENYLRNLVLQDGYFCVYAIGWEPGQISVMHHHGNALDAIWVIDGEMEHWRLNPEECQQKNVLFEGHSSDKNNKHEGQSEIFSTGDWVFIDRLHAHQIKNSSRQRLSTLHFRFGIPPKDNKWNKAYKQASYARYKPSFNWYKFKQYKLMPTLK
jgi:transcriptional regulator with XRE-family HTH domain/predicted metal-dependent enzyme (double-stranded beta helix superfamily)